MSVLPDGQPSGQPATLALAADPEGAARRLQQQFTSMVSHEFRTSLAIIDAAAQNIGLQDQDSIRRVNKIRAAVQRLTRMMDVCLDEGRMEVAHDQVRIATFDLRVLLDDVVRSARTAAPTRRIDLLAAPDGLVVDADPRLLKIAIGNILVNAVQYSPAGSTVTATAAADQGGIEVMVEDGGRGVPEADRERIFEKYQRSDNTAGIPGAGLGLYVARQILERHGGSVRYAQAESGGCRFILWVPNAACTSGGAGR